MFFICLGSRTQIAPDCHSDRDEALPTTGALRPVRSDRTSPLFPWEASEEVHEKQEKMVLSPPCILRELESGLMLGTPTKLGELYRESFTQGGERVDGPTGTEWLAASRPATAPPRHGT